MILEIFETVVFSGTEVKRWESELLFLGIEKLEILSGAVG